MKSLETIEELAKEVDPLLFYVAKTGEHLLYFKVDNPEGKQYDIVAKEIAKKAGTKFMGCQTENNMSRVVYSLGKIEDPEPAKKSVIAKIHEEVEGNPMIVVINPESVERGIKNLKERIMFYISEASTPKEIERIIESLRQEAV